MTWTCVCGHANEPRYRYLRNLGRKKKVGPGKTCRACRIEILLEKGFTPAT